MIFISLAKLRKKPTKDGIAEQEKRLKEATKEGVKFLGVYWTLGRYDIVYITECPDVKAAMKYSIKVADIAATETLVAVSAEEARKLVE